MVDLLRRARAGLARHWFPLTLAALLVAALPALALVLLHLFGDENAVNGLLGRLGLAYHWPLPLWAAVLAALLPLLLLVLYFLKLKRQPLAVPSTFLWRKSIEDVHVNSLFQWLRRNLLLLLQLATLLVLLYALLQLQVQGETARGKHYVILIDNSASMSATDVRPSRLELAREQALALIDGRADGDAGMVIAFNTQAVVVQSYNTDPGLLRRAVEGIRPTQRGARLDLALERAGGRANPLKSADDQATRPDDEDPGKARLYVEAEGLPAEVHLFSDGRFADVPGFALGNLHLHYHAVGRPGPTTVDNIGLVSLAAQRDEKDPRLLHVFGRVRNYRPRTAPVRVQLEVRVAGALHTLREQPVDRTGVVEARKVTATTDEPGEGLVHFRLHDVQDQADVTLHARLLGVKDDFALDDEAWLVVGVVRRARVLLVRPTPNPFVESFLDQATTQRLATVDLLAPADLEEDEKYRRPARDGRWDLVIFDRCAPVREADLPYANTFFLDSLPPPWKRAGLPELRSPRVRGWAARDPLLHGLTGLQEIDVGRGFLFDLRQPGLPARVPRLLETDNENALLFRLPRRAFTDLVMAFPLVTNEGEWNSFWPLRLSFPLFLKNVLIHLGNVAGDEWVQPGQTKRLRPDAGVGKVEVQAPTRKSYTVTRGARPDFPFTATEEVGLYAVRWDDRVQRHFAVNLLDSQESNLEPRPAFKVGDEEVAAGQTRKAPRDLWKAIAALALALLMLEWYVYHRRTIV